MPPKKLWSQSSQGDLEKNTPSALGNFYDEIAKLISLHKYN